MTVVAVPAFQMPPGHQSTGPNPVGFVKRVADKPVGHREAGQKPPPQRLF
jgi:hypothetical protein